MKNVLREIGYMGRPDWVYRVQGELRGISVPNSIVNWIGEALQSDKGSN
jgi:hypothetical protein